MLAFNIILKVYWSKKSVDFGITDLEFLRPLQAPVFKKALRLNAKVSANSRRICIPHCQEHD